MKFLSVVVHVTVPKVAVITEHETGWDYVRRAGLADYISDSLRRIDFVMCDRLLDRDDISKLCLLHFIT